MAPFQSKLNGELPRITGQSAESYAACAVARFFCVLASTLLGRVRSAESGGISQKGVSRTRSSTGDARREALWIVRNAMPTLFDPLTVGDWRLPNRVVLAPLTRTRA